MKTLRLSFVIVAVAAIVLASAGSATLEAAPSPEADVPIITGISFDDGTVVVTVAVPSGIKRVILESKTRLGHGAWVPRAVQRLNGEQSEEVEFRVKFDSQSELLRVRAGFEEELPATFYSGESEFNGEASTVEPAGVDARFGAPETAAPGTDASDSATGSAEVVESDIWQIDGDRVYFFNQYKGLQVIDIANPDQPQILGTLDLASGGEQMYMLGEDHVVLLARDNCDYGPSALSQILVINVASGSPSVVGTVSFGGYIQESRMLGTAAYVITQSYSEITEDERRAWEWSTKVYSFDLSNPANPTKSDELKYVGYGTMATAQGTTLFVNVGNRSWDAPTTIQMIDISSPAGAMAEQGQIEAAGWVKDKFKINLKGGVVSVVSEVRRTDTGRPRISRLENFSIEDPHAPRRIGHVDVGEAESLFATRFDGDLVYVVTFRQIDPLWIIDNSNPVRPVITGELEIPGWSNYIHPLGDRLITIGIDNIDGWRAAVQLFDVSDPTAPKLLSKVPLGEGNSWSEANYDEKAFKVFPTDGLILVPFSSYSNSGGYASAVQLIDLERDSLAQRGVIEHQMQPRRATYVSERILSISGREFLVVDGSDRDNPVVTADLTLSWPVSNVVEYGSFLIEVVDDTAALGAGTLTVVSKSNLDEILDEASLRSGWTLAGMEERDGRLYTLQVKGESSWIYYADPANGDDAVEVPEPEENVMLTVYDLGDLPRLVETGSVTAITDPIWSWTQLSALWPRDGVLVWSGQNSYYWGGPWLATDALVADAVSPRFWGGGGGGGRLIAFDVKDDAQPSLSSDLSVFEEQNYWNTSSAFTANGLVYLSYQQSVYYTRDSLPEGVDWPARLKDSPLEGFWTQKYFLSVIDYADPSEPTRRPTANIPGNLIGLSRNGSVIYTQGYHWESDATSDYRNWIDAVAYDGLEVHRIDSLSMPNRWPQPATVANGSVFLGKPGTTTDAETTENVVEVWRLGDNGKFAMAELFGVSSPVSEFHVVDDLLTARTYYELRFFGLPDQDEIIDLGEVGDTGCHWFDLSHSDGNMDEGLWVPMNALGVSFLPVAPAAE